MTKTKSTWQIILSHTCTYFNFLNLVLALLVILSGQYKQMLFLGVVISNTLIGIVQELKVKKLIDKLSVITATKARRITDDGIQEIRIDEIRTGDTLCLACGDQIAADATVVSSDGLEVNESLLTGESVPVHKNPGDTLFSGSHVTAGSATCTVVHTGDENYATRLVAAARTKKRAASEMQDAIKKIIRYVSYAIVPIGITLFFIQRLRVKSPLSDSLVNTVAGVLGMIPEGLVLLTSISFILGVGRLARKRALVQEMEAIEALARVNILCLDKTGTITTGRLTVTDFLCLSPQQDASACKTILYNLVHACKEDNDTSSALKLYLNTSDVPQKDRADALITAFVPFSSRRKFMGVSYENASYVLGAPDFLTGNKDVLDNANRLGEQGLRVLLLASCTSLADSADKLGRTNPLALIALADEIKEDAPSIFRFFAEQGVSVKILSGDNPATVSAVGKNAGIPDAEKCIDASALEGKSFEKISSIVSKHTVFGRVSPEMKQTIIKAFQKLGNTTAMVGDGVNDVLALKEADCGIAMAGGSDAARQTAHIVVLDSNFSSMKDIVKEGRTIIANIERVSALYLTKTIYSILLCVLFIIIGKSYPFIPIQLSLIGACMIGIPSFLLTLERNDRVTSSGFLRHVLHISVPAALILTGILAGFQWISERLCMDPHLLRTLNLVAGGLVSLGVVIRVCLPLNKRRAALCTGIALVFFGAMLLLPQVFDILPFSTLFTVFFAD